MLTLAFLFCESSGPHLHGCQLPPASIPSSLLRLGFYYQCPCLCKVEIKQCTKHVKLMPMIHHRFFITLFFCFKYAQVEIAVPKGIDFPMVDFLKNWYTKCGFVFVKEAPYEVLYPKTKGKWTVPMSCLVY